MTEQPATNRKIVLRRRPGQLVAAEDTAIVSAQIPPLADGQALIRTELLAMDPVTRVIINEDIGLVPPIALGEPLRSFGGGIVVSSRAPDLPIGARVTDFFEWAEWQIISKGPRTNILPAAASLESGLNIYGHTAMAAYFGMLEIGKPLAGETVVISGAAGAVGSVAGQIARIAGARVIGITGGKQKCRWLMESLGFDGAVDYKDSTWPDELKQLTPTGIDLFFDNVGGAILDSVLVEINPKGRVVACGASSQYASTKPLAAPSNPNNIAILRFNAMDFTPRFAEATERMFAWEHAGVLKFPYSVIEGLERAPDALNMLFDGRSRGRVLVKIS